MKEKRVNRSQLRNRKDIRTYRNEKVCPDVPVFTYSNTLAQEELVNVLKQLCEVRERTTICLM